MTRLSVIIPALSSQAELDETLLSVLENRPERCEVLLVHPRTYHDPYELSDEVRFVPVPDTATRLAMLGAGVRASRGKVVQFLHPGCLATPGWSDPVVRRFDATPNLGSVVPRLVDVGGAARPIPVATCWTRRGAARYLVDLEQCRRILALGSAYLGPLLRAGFFRRQALVPAATIWNDPGSDIADLSLAIVLAHNGWSCQIEDQARIRACPIPIPSGYRWARDAELLYHWTRRTFGLQRTTGHGWLVACEFLRRLPRPSAWTGLAGRLAGWWSARRPGKPTTAVRPAHPDPVPNLLGYQRLEPPDPTDSSAGPGNPDCRTRHARWSRRRWRLAG